MSNYGERSRHAEDRHGIAVCVSLVAVIVGVAHLLLRWGLQDNDPALVLRVILLAFFVLLLPHGCEMCLSYWSKDREDSWYSSHPAFSLLALGLVVLGGMGQDLLGIDIWPIFCAVGAALIVLTFGTWLRDTTVRDALVLIAGSCLVGILAAASFYGDICHHPLIVEAIGVGRTHMDLLCAAATTNMIKTYGVPSTGLDGIPYYSYHWGSWWIFAQFCKLLKVGSLRFLSLGFPTIFFPLLLQSMLTFAVELNRKSLHCGNGNSRLVSDPVFWAFIFVALAGFVPRQFQPDIMMGPSEIGSESYAVGVTFAFMAFTFGLFLTSMIEHRERHWSSSDLIFPWIVAPALLGLLTLTKLSIGFIVAVLLGCFFIRFRLYRSFVFATSLMLCALSALFVVKCTFWPANLSGKVPTTFYPLHFLITYVPWQMWPAFLLGHFFWSWLFVITALYCQGVRRLEGLRAAIAHRHIVDVETVVLVCAIAAAPGLLLAIGDRNALYFSNFQSWVAFAFILGNINRFRSVLVSARGNDAGSKMARGRVRVKRLAVGALVTGAFLVAGTNLGYSLATMVYFNLSIRSCLCSQQRVVSSNEMGCGVKARLKGLLRNVLHAAEARDVQSVFRCVREGLGPLFTQVQEGLQRGPAYSMMHLLEEVAKLPRSEKKCSLLFIPQNNKDYWQLVKPDLVMALGYPGCKAVPFIAPSITGIALLDGMPAVGCDTTVYGFDCYTRRTSAQTLSVADIEGLCARAKLKGFFRVLTVSADGAGNLILRRLNCCNGSRSACCQ